MVTTVGILALQGDFARHERALARLELASRQVRYPDELDGLAALIIPGGESTTISKQLSSSGLRSEIVAFARQRPVMGTCAGLILMARKSGDPQVEPLGLLDLEISRNGWGRQVHSFRTTLTANIDGDRADLPAIFIRAPRIVAIGPEVEVLAELEGDPVLVRQGHHLAMSFHPELTSDARIHSLFMASQVA